MRVRFWGTRGSIPVALTTADVRDKLAQALLQASGRTLRELRGGARLRQLRARLLAHAHLRRPHAVRRDRDRRATSTSSATWAAARARSACTCSPSRRARPRRSTSSCPTCTGTTSWASPSSGRPTSRARRSASTAATTCSSRPSACSSRRRASRWSSTQLGATIEFVKLEPDKTYEVSRPHGHAAPAAARRRFLRLPLRARRQVGGLLHRLRAQAREPRRGRGASPTSSATPTW